MPLEKKCRQQAMLWLLYPLFPLTLLALSACATPQQAAGTVSVTSDSYCLVAEKITWSKRDTRETITGVRRENAKHDRLCGVSPKTS